MTRAISFSPDAMKPSASCSQERSLRAGSLSRIAKCASGARCAPNRLRSRRPFSHRTLPGSAHPSGADHRGPVSMAAASAARSASPVAATLNDAARRRPPLGQLGRQGGVGGDADQRFGQIGGVQRVDQSPRRRPPPGSRSPWPQQRRTTTHRLGRGQTEAFEQRRIHQRHRTVEQRLALSLVRARGKTTESGSARRFAASCSPLPHQRPPAITKR